MLSQSTMLSVRVGLYLKTQWAAYLEIIPLQPHTKVPNFRVLGALVCCPARLRTSFWDRQVASETSGECCVAVNCFDWVQRFRSRRSSLRQSQMNALVSFTSRHDSAEMMQYLNIPSSRDMDNIHRRILKEWITVTVSTILYWTGLLA